MPHMCLSRVSKVVGHVRTHPLALSMPGQLTAAGDPPGAPRRLAEAGSAEDGREVPAVPTRVSAALRAVQPARCSQSPPALLASCGGARRTERSPARRRGRGCRVSP
jgi:hypothetical protein